MDSKLPKPTLQAVDGPLASFTLFPKLLIEIRRVIWKLSLPGERYFEFVSMYEPGRCPVSYVHCKNKQIPHMSVCQESRTEALREYKKFRANCTGCPPVYVSPSLDVFCFAGRIMDEVEECLHHTMAQFPIKRLATSAGLGETRELTKEWLFALELDELIMVSGEQELYYGDPGIVGLKDGWTVKDGLFGWLNELAKDCREIEERNPGWKAPVLRMGKWVLSNPSEWTHATSNWLDRAWKCYGEGVRDGTIERRECDHEDWDRYLKDN